MSRRTFAFTLTVLLATAPAAAFPIDDNCWPNTVSIGIVAGHNFPLVRQANVGWVRITIPWREVNPDPGTWNFGGIENLVSQAQAQGLEILAILSTAPEWAGGGPLGIRPPENVALWREFVRRTADRFAGRITAYEVWNEPNFLDIGIHGVGWDRPLDSPPLYTDYLRVAAQEIRVEAPGALVVGPVTSSRPDERTEALFRLIEAENASQFVDVVSFHANGFDRIYDEVKADVDRSLGLIASQNPSNAGKPIWITEMGWLGGSSGREEVGGENAQRDLIRRILTEMAGGFGCTWPTGFAIESDNGWSEHAITHAFIFELVDTEDDTSGVYRADLSPKAVVEQYLRTLAFPARQTSGPWHVEVSRNCSGRSCSFSAGPVGLAEPQANLVYRWDFGDGVVRESTGPSINHEYQQPGRYFVRLGVEASTTRVSLGSAILLVNASGSAPSGGESIAKPLHEDNSPGVPGDRSLTPGRAVATRPGLSRQ